MFLRDKITVLVSPKSLLAGAAPPDCKPELLGGPAGLVPGLPPPGLGGLGGLGEFKLIATFPV